MTRRAQQDKILGDVPNPVARGLAAVGIAVSQFVVALYMAAKGTGALVTLAGLVLVISCVIWPSLVLTAVFPASFATMRVGPGALGMSVADAVTALGLLAAFPHIPWRSKAFRTVMFVALGYSAVVSVAVVAHFSVAGAVEVVHRFVMVVGTVAIGAAVVRTDKVTAALRGLVAAGAIVSIAAVVNTLSQGLDPAYPFGIQKNAAGSLLVGTILVVFFAERHLRLPRTVVMPLGIVLVCGLAATQSRGAGTALVAVALVYVITMLWERKGRRLVRVLPLVLVLGVGVAAVMYTSYQSEAADHQGADAKFGSAGSRKITYDKAWENVIKPNPVFGLGPKWFNDPHAPAGEPHNMVLDEMASDGVVGLVALTGLLFVLLRVAKREKSSLGELAFYVLLARIIADQFDLFWVAGPNTLPFLILGLAVGSASLHDEPQDQSEPQPIMVGIDGAPQLPPFAQVGR